MLSLTRRQLLAAAAALTAGPLWPRGIAPRDWLPLLEAAAAGTGTTLDRRIAIGGSGSGFRPLIATAGEPHLVRTLGGARAQAGRETRRRSLLHLVHLTDVHLIDTQSPARVEFLDRFNDPPASSSVPFSAAWRPHEFLSTHINAAMLDALAGIALSPVTGAPIQLAINTGDAIDNQHLCELRWAIDLLDGGIINPDTGTVGYQGVQDAVNTDPDYYHPENPAADHFGPLGWPALPGLLRAAMQPFHSRGVGVPWISVFGNHDGLVQGNLPANSAVEAIATGTLKPSGLPASYTPQDYLTLYSANPAAAVALAAPRVVGADPRRTLVSHQRYIAEHFVTTGTPVGHGFTTDNRANDTGYYVHDPVGSVRLIALDTLNRGGYNDGSIDQAQLDWLTSQLVSSSSRHLDASGAWVSTPNRDRLVLILSHHTVATMTNPVVDPGNPGQRILGDQVAALLLRFPNVIAWINGHTHVNSITPRPGIAGKTAGFWEINTAAHIDWPAQCRLVEVVDNRDGTLSIFGTLLDHAGGLAVVSRAQSALDLAATSRAIGANDNQKGAVALPTAAGGSEDRNVELLLPAPFDLAASSPGQGPPGDTTTRGGGGGQGSPDSTAVSGDGLAAAAAAAVAVLGAATVAARRRGTGSRPRLDTED